MHEGVTYYNMRHQEQVWYIVGGGGGEGGGGLAY